LLGVGLLVSPASAQAGNHPTGADAKKRWWMDEPVRLVLVNMPETRSTIDTDKMIQQLVDLNANTVLTNMGGVAAQYPTNVEGHVRSPYLSPGRDLFGEILQKAHAHGIRVMGRFDFSSIESKAVYDAHPDWFFRQANGQPVIYNGTYWTCINGGYYQQKTFEILSEALAKYPVDGLFFNASGQKVADYSNKTYGLCHCDNCRRLFREKYHRDIPDHADAQYTQFTTEANRQCFRRLANSSIPSVQASISC